MLPAVKVLREIQHVRRQARFSPFARRKSVGFRQGRVAVYPAQDYAQPEPMAHCKHEFRNNLRGAGADNCDTQYFVAFRRRQYLYEYVGLAIGDRPVQIIDAVLPP